MDNIAGAHKLSFSLFKQKYMCCYPVSCYFHLPPPPPPPPPSLALSPRKFSLGDDDLLQTARAKGNHHRAQ